ncbi:CrcB family protein [Virgibacillus sp. 179-BFC.A HS]|uniref:Fluoride-specific ion channel FluC n=1 Tax=Tigheibacillus jepli TaxID=3035914 RepID=A0ABU5CE74_9BACI|nr:CrcB family protein [Virgibacillus sp. 179-BFC.A HS]MDY0404581.1 CrcB family protein [Virgibacillus sp. 179-BFC.A HS]
MGYIAVGLAGIVGSLLRYYMSVWLGDASGVFPWATLVTNLIGCFLLGYFTSRIAKIAWLHPPIATAIGTGLIGSFTTFSTFSTETVTLVVQGHAGLAAVYVGTSAVFGLLFSLWGYRAGTFIHIARSKSI